MSEEEYAQQVDYVRLFLAGKDDQVLTQLIARMEKASQALEFEEAARIRDQIQARTSGNGETVRLQYR